MPPAPTLRCACRAPTTLPVPSPMVRPLAAVAERLACADGGVSVVIAPGGYGKTSQVALWARSDQRTVAWIDLETEYDDAEQPAAGHPRSARRRCRRTRGDARNRPADPASVHHPRRTGTRPRHCARSARPFVLVLDDVHHLLCQPSLDMLEALVRNVPAASTIVLIGRAAPSLALPALRAQGCATDVTIDQLSLDESETRAVAEGMGAQLDDSAVEELLRDTDGWPLGVQLVGGALAEAGGVAPGTRRTPSDAIEIAHHYVEDEWLRGLEPADADLLQRVSGLGWVSGALCDHVLGSHDSGVRLDRLHTSGLLMAPLDRRGNLFRAHQVIRDTLDESFQRRDRGAHRETHQRACDWFESSRGHRSSRRAGAPSRRRRAGSRTPRHRARRVLPHEGPDAARSGVGSTAMPRDTCAEPAPVCASCQQSRRSVSATETAAATWTRFGEACASEGTSSDPRPEAIGSMLRSFRAMLWLDPLEESLEMAERVPLTSWRLVPGRALARTTQGALCFALGDDAAAIDAFSRCLGRVHMRSMPRRSRHWDWPTSPSCSSQPISRIEALRLGRQARQILRDRGLEHMPSMALVAAISALVESTSGDTDVARGDLKLARSHLAYLHSVAEWHHLQANLALAYTSLRLGDLVAARMFLRETETLLERHGDAVRCKQQVAELTQRLRSAKDVLPCGPSSLTAAELRVLHYLPTNLTHEEIAARLYVSRNTTKSHAASIYRKLGVASRSEAVEVSRAAGLLSLRCDARRDAGRLLRRQPVRAMCRAACGRRRAVRRGRRPTARRPGAVVRFEPAAPSDGS
jgi:LuxR family transcriptional regulator, maltose regulon positive regulatory protein